MNQNKNPSNVVFLIKQYVCRIECKVRRIYRASSTVRPALLNKRNATLALHLYELELKQLEEKYMSHLICERD